MTDQDQRLQFVESVELAQPNQRTVHPTDGDSTWWPSSDSAQIVAGALVAFDQSVSAQEVADVGNSLLFAQLAADVKQDRFSAPMEWSRAFTGVLEAVGWSIQQHASGSPVRQDPPMDWAGLVAKGLSDPTGKALAAKAMASAANLAPGSDALDIWGRCGARATEGNFVVQSCWISNGDVACGSVQVAYHLVSDPADFLTWPSHYEFQTVAAAMTLNEDIYAQVRQAIVDKLGDRPKRYIAPVPM